MATLSLGMAEPPQTVQPTPGASTRTSTPSRTPLSLFPVTTVWTLALNNRLIAPPAYDATHAYFPVEGGRIVAYRLATGAQAWTAFLKPEMEPVTGDGLLFVVEPRVLTALRTTDATIAWQSPLEEKLAVRPVWDNGWLVAATASGTILAFRAIDGHLVWRRGLRSVAHAPPALAADHVYVPTEDGHVVALRVDAGTPAWERRLGGAANEILALDERLYVGSKDNFFYCLETRDGTIRWRWRTGGDVIGLPVVDASSVYFVSLDNILRALDRKNGVQRWHRPLPLRPTTGPVLANGTVVVTGLAPTLRGYNANDGTPAGDLSTDGEVATPPHLVQAAGNPLPRLLVLTRHLAKGASAILVTRSVEPPIQPFALLPNPIVRPPVLVGPGSTQTGKELPPR